MQQVVETPTTPDADDNETVTGAINTTPQDAEENDGEDDEVLSDSQYPAVFP